MPDHNREGIPMSEIATVEESSIEILPPAQHASSRALAVLRDESQAMDMAYQYASAVCRTRVCPARFFQKPEDGAAAILYGIEIGLSPSAALQKVVVIHGMPSLEARTMVALLKPRGYKVKTLEQTDESVTVQGTDLDGETHTSTWTIERAIKAGYVPTIDERTGKYKTNSNDKLIGNEKYLTDPQAMLKAKAQAEVCRDMAPDVLLGITYSTEDLESERWDDRAPQQPVTAASQPVTVEEILGDAQPDPEKPKKKPRKKTEPSPDRAEAVEAAKEQLDADEAAEKPAENIPENISAATQPEPTPDTDVVLATPDQLQKLGSLLAMDGFDDSDEGKAGRLDFCRQAVKRPLESARDLTSTEVDSLIELLDREPREVETDEGN